MNLLAAKNYDPTGGAVSKATTSLLAMTAIDTTNLRNAVTVPAHGMLHIRMSCIHHGSTTTAQGFLGCLDGSTLRGRCAPTSNLLGTAIATTQIKWEVAYTLTGLTPGAMNLDAAYGVEIVSSAGGALKYGGPNDTTTNNGFGGFNFEVWDPQPLKVALDGGVNVTQFGGTAGTFSGGRPEVNTSHAAGTAWGSGAITAASIAADAIGASELAADAVTKIAAGVWQTAVAGNFTVASSIGKSLYTGNVVPGGSGGLLISGSNAGTTTLGALAVTGATTLTGNVALANGLTIAQATADTAGVEIIGNGEFPGILCRGGDTGDGAFFQGGALGGNGIFARSLTGFNGIYAIGSAAGSGIHAIGEHGITGFGTVAGHGLRLTTSGTGNGINVTTAAGDGVSITPTAGNAITATANGTSKHGIVATGGTAGTSDGIKAAAGSGGVDIRGAITGNITGNLSGSVGSVTGLTAANLDVAVSTRLATAGYTAPDNPSITAIKTKTDSLSFTVAGQVDANIQYVNDVQVVGNGAGAPWGPA